MNLNLSQNDDFQKNQTNSCVFIFLDNNALKQKDSKKLI